MSKIKSILAFVAVLLCGGAFAAPTVLWDGDFSSYRQGNTDTYVRTIGSETYTLTLNGHSVETDSETGLEYLLIKEQSDSKLGVTIERTPTSSTATGGTLIMRYSDYKYNSSNTHRVAMTIDCERDGYHNILDIFANNADNTIVADWADFYNNNNSTPYSAKETSSNLEVDANDEHTIRMLTLTYGNGKGGFSFQRKVDGTWQKVYSHTGLLGSSTYVVNRFAVGGLARASQRGNNNTSMTSTKVADGMKVYSIAVDAANQNTVPTTSTFSNFSFASDANYFATANGDANLTNLSWTDANGTATSLPATIDSNVKLAISGTGTISYTGSFGGSAYLHKNVTLVPTSVSNAKVAGSGTIVYDANNTNTEPSFTVDNAWTGTVWLKNLRSDTYSSNKNQALATPATLNNLGKTKSIIKMTNCAGYVSDGSNDSAFPWILELDGDSAWENLSGWSARTRTYGGLKGDGVLGFFGMGVNSHCSEVERFTDASNFSGSINVGNDANPYYTGKRVIIGSDNLATGDSGQILVSSGKTVTVANGKTWTANAMFVNGIIKGSGTINANFTLKNGATIDLTGNAADAALTIETNHTLTLGDSINLVNPTEGGAILKGVATEPEGLALRMVTVNGAVVDGAHLYYDDNAIKYSAQVATTWTPRDSAITDEIFDWTATDAWTDLSGNAATWPSDQATASALDINLDTTKIKGIKVTGQVYVGNLAVAGTLESEESFQFYNHLLEEGVDNDHEVNPDGDGHDCLHAKSVNLTKLEGGLGLKVPITGSIAFGANTQLTFVTGSAEGTPSTAYAYEFVDRGGSITVSGEGKFNVPSSMYGLPFSVARTATIVYEEGKEIAGAISGEGKVITKGSGTATLTAENTVSGGITVEAGTLKSGHNGAFGTGTITVANGAALDFAGFDSNSTGYTVVCNGGTLKATGLIYANQNCIKSLTLGGNSEINGSGRIGVTMADASATTLDLGTYTLTVNGGAYLNLRNTTVSGTGTIDVSNGTLLPWGVASSASNVSLNLGASGHAEMNVGLTVKNFSMASGATFTGTNNGAITVTGKLSGTGSIPKLTLGDGATIDATGDLKVTDTLTFEGGIKVYGNDFDTIITKVGGYTDSLPTVTRVDVAGNTISGNTQIMSIEAIVFGEEYTESTITASALNKKGGLAISGDLTIYVDADIVNTHVISSSEAATVTIKPTGTKTFISAADVKKLSFSSNITVNYVWNVPTKIINLNFGSSENGVMSGDTTDKTFGGEDVPRNAWNGYSANSETSAAVSTGWDCAASKTFPIVGMTVGYSGRGGNHKVGTKITPCAPFMWGYIDDNSSSDVQVTLSGIPFDRYDVIVYFQGDTADHFFSTPQIIKGDTTTVYSYDSEMNVVTGNVANNFHWGQSLQSDISYEKNVFRIPNQTGDIKVQPQRFINNNGQRRATIAAIQIVALPAAVRVGGGESTYYSTVGAALEGATEGQTVLLLAASAEDIEIPANVTVDVNGFAFSGTVSGAGTIKFATIPTTFSMDEAWTGVVELGSIDYGSTKTGYNISGLVHDGSVLKLHGITGNNIYFTNANKVNGTVELVENAVFRINNGSSNTTYEFAEITGSGTFKTDMTGPSNVKIKINKLSSKNVTLTNSSKSAITIDDLVVEEAYGTPLVPLADCSAVTVSKVNGVVKETMQESDGIYLVAAKIGDNKHKTVQAAIDSLGAEGDISTIQIVGNPTIPCGYYVVDGYLARWGFLATNTGDNGTWTIPAVTESDIETSETTKTRTKGGNDSLITYAIGSTTAEDAKKLVISTRVDLKALPSGTANGAVISVGYYNTADHVANVFYTSDKHLTINYNNNGGAVSTTETYEGEHLIKMVCDLDKVVLYVDGNKVLDNTAIQCHQFKDTYKVQFGTYCAHTDWFVYSTAVFHSCDVNVVDSIVSEMAASDLNELGTMRINANATLNVDTDITGTPSIINASGSEVTLTLKAVAPKTYVSAADVKKLQLGTNVTLAYDWKPGKIISMNLNSGNSANTQFYMTGDAVDGTLGGSIPRNSWNNLEGGAGTKNVTLGYSYNSEGEGSTFDVSGMSLIVTANGTHNSNIGGQVVAPFMHGYIDDAWNNDTPSTYTLSGIPFSKYDVVVYFQCDTADGTNKYGALQINDTTNYGYNDAGEVVTVAGSTYKWGKSRQANFSYENNTIRIVNQKGGTLKIVPLRPTSDQRSTIAAIQIIDSSDQTVANPTGQYRPDTGAVGCFSGWGDSTADNNKTVGPFGVGVVQRLSSGWHPYARNLNLATEGENNEFTLGLYANIEQVKPATGKHAVLWSMGDFNNPGNRYILAKEPNGDVKLYLSETEKLTIPASKIGAGYHLFTMVFSATSGTKLILDDNLDSVYEDANLKAVQAAGGFQVGQGYGTNPANFVTGTDMGVAVVIAYQVALNAEQLEEYVLRYPVSTTFSSDIDNHTAGYDVLVPSMSALGNQLLGATRGTLTIPAGAEVVVPHVRTLNEGSSTATITMNVDGTLRVTSETANADVYGQRNNYKGVLFGHWNGAGAGTYNIRGTLDAPLTGIEVCFSAGKQTVNVIGGMINTKAFYIPAANKGEIKLSDSATINLSLEGADQNVPFTNVSDANKISATSSMTFSQAITLTAGTLEFDVAAGKTVTISGAVSGEGKILKKVNGKGELVFTGDVASGIVADVTGLLPGEEYVVAKGAFDAETVAKCEVTGGEGWSIVNRGSHIAVRHQIATVGETPCYTIVDIASAVAAGGTTITITSDSLVFNNGSFVLNGTPVEGISATDNGDGTYEVVVTYEGADEHNLIVSEICPKTTAWDENHKDAGWLELHNTGSTWVNFGEYTLGRYNRGKAVKATEWTNGVTLSIAPGARLVIKTSEDYSVKSKKTIIQYGEDLGNAIVFDSKVNPKKYPLVVLIKGGKVVQNCVVPVDVPENMSVCYDGELKNGAIASYITTASKGEASNFEGAVAVGPQISPLYAVKDAVDPWQKFPKATIGEDYAITVPVNPILGGNDNNEIASVQLIYRLDFGAEVVVETPMTKSETKDSKNGYTYTGTIPGSQITTAGQLVRWAVRITDVGGNVWRAPSFNNGDDGYEYFGTIVTPSEEQLSGGLNTWHLFADPEEVADGIGTENMKPNALMNKDADESGFTTTLHPNGGRVGIYDMETGLYYDNVRIDKRGRTTGAFTKKAHGLKFSKSQPFTGTDSLTGESIECRKSSLTAEYGDPTFIRQELAFEVMRRNGVKAPFHYPVRLNLNGQFYQLAFHSERFSDELIEDFYGLDPKGYAYKNVGPFHNGNGWNNSSERKTPDDGSPDLTINDPVLKAFCDTLNGAGSINENTDFSSINEFSADLSKVVAKSFDLPAWINYMAATKITAETDDVWANLSAYYDINGTGTWMPLAYDMNQSLGQWHFADDRNRGRIGLVADIDNFKSHPFYGGLHIRMHKSSGEASGNPNYAYEAIFQNAKFRRLFLRRLRTIMDKEIGATVYADQASEKSALFTSAAQMVATINELGLKDRSIWTDYANVDFANNTDRSTNGSCDKIWVWPQSMTEQLGTPQGGLKDLWDNYVKPRRAYLYGKHLASNGTVDVGYGLNLSAGIPAAQSDIATLKGTDENPKITSRYDATLGTVIIENDNDETIDLSGWKLTGPVTMTIPEGTVLDRKVGEVKGQVYLTANRTATIAALGANLADQVIVGNGTANSAETPISLRTDAGVRVVGEPTAQELNIRFDAFYGATLGDGDENEWFSIKNIGEAAVEYTGMTVCILKDGDGEEKDHCHVTLPEGTIEAGASKKFVKDDFATGFVKIQNNTVNISVYDLYMSPIQKMQVTQKDYTWAYQHGAYLEHQTDSGKWHQIWDSGDLTLADYLSDKGKNVKALAKDLYVRASTPMTITLENPSFDASSTLKISGEGTVTITGTLNAKVNTTAIKSTGNLAFTDGSYTITSSDDCIQADGDITINGGTFICHSTGNDGIDANQNIVINGGTIYAFTAATEDDDAKSTGLDVNTGHMITINGGTVIATSLEADALNKLTLEGSQAAKVVAVTGLAADEAKTIAIADILVPFPAMATVPTAVLVSKPGMTSDSTVEVEEEAPGTVEIVAEDAEAGTEAVHATVPASWKAHAAVEAGTITEKQAAEAFVLGLAEPTEKPMVSSEQTAEADSIRIVDNVAPRFGTGVTVKRTLFVGTTPGEEAADNTIEETNGGFTVPLPTEGSKVKYIKIKYSFK